MLKGHLYWATARGYTYIFIWGSMLEEHLYRSSLLGETHLWRQICCRNTYIWALLEGHLYGSTLKRRHLYGGTPLGVHLYGGQFAGDTPIWAPYAYNLLGGQQHEGTLLEEHLYGYTLVGKQWQGALWFQFGPLLNEINTYQNSLKCNLLSLH